MTTERRYQEDEVAAIFEAAAAPPSVGQAAGAAHGLTLAELQQIGREVGLAPGRVAAAAAAVDRSRAAVPRRTDLGLPLTAGRMIDLPRPLTDHEWALLVAELRQVFAARGHERTDGETRQWSNGNLHAFVEPTVNGHRLRLGTLKGDAAAVNRLGIAGIITGSLLAVGMAVTGQPGGEYVASLVLGGLGGGALAYNTLRLPRWAREREAQMDHIVERTRALLEAADPDTER